MSLSTKQLEALRIFAEAAVASERTTGVPAEMTLAQAILESAWGTSMPPDSQNCFGIKDTDKLPGASYCFTTEWVGGVKKKLKLAFEVFPTMAACFAAHGELISGGPEKKNCYAPHFRLFSADRDLRGYLWGIAAHYATDPHYPQSVMGFWQMSEFKAALDSARMQKGF